MFVDGKGPRRKSELMNTTMQLHFFPERDRCYNRCGQTPLSAASAQYSRSSPALTRSHHPFPPSSRQSSAAFCYLWLSALPSSIVSVFAGAVFHHTSFFWFSFHLFFFYFFPLFFHYCPLSPLPSLTQIYISPAVN